ncbi:MAG TPA: TetR/AcrR family transcriptional regulator [Puia sp.]|nr:TetR/AcrR family transcriptional regulator [Puia sp.]
MKPRDDKKIRQVFDATLKIVNESGLSGITMSDIAKEAGLATGTVYIYFKNKIDLINSLYSECRKSSANVFFKDFDEHQPFKIGFGKIVSNIIKHRTGHFDEAVFMEQCNHSPFITETTKQASRQIMEPLFTLIEKGKKEQLIKPLDTRLLLIYMIGCINEVIKQYRYNHKKIDKQLTTSLFTLCWDGLKL